MTDGAVRDIAADKEVILAAGTIHSHGGVLKVVAGQADGTFAGGLHKSGRD